MPGGRPAPSSDGGLQESVDRLLTQDRDAHERAIRELRKQGDDRVVPHLVELAMIDSIADNWTDFGFPEVIRNEKKPRYLELPEARWPGVIDALSELADPEYDSDIAWVRWESWYSQRDIEPLEGFDEWKVRLYKSFLPPVGSLLDVESRRFDIRDVRYGNTDRSFLAALNKPEFVPAEMVTLDGVGGDYERYLREDELVYGFEIDDQAYAVPRMILFPHELVNATFAGTPVMLAWCTLCNTPILYDRRVDGRTLTFGNTGMLLNGNKIMYDEETESLWAQHTGRPLAGPYLEEERTLDILPVSQTNWADWYAENPDTLVPHTNTGYGYDYQFYDGNVGFFDHYWENEDIAQPGVKTDRRDLPEKETVYGVVDESGSTVHVYPVDSVDERGPLIDNIDGREVVVLGSVRGYDVAVFEAPSLPVERDGDVLVDADGREWVVGRDALESDGDRLERLPGRRGLWFAFRIQYEQHVIVTGEE